MPENNCGKIAYCKHPWGVSWLDPSADGLLSRMFFVYVIRNQLQKIYIGQTNNLDQRLKWHNGELAAKSTSYTKKQKGPWEYIYTEECETRSSALKREKALKSSRGREFIQTLGR